MLCARILSLFLFRYYSDNKELKKRILLLFMYLEKKKKLKEISP